VIGRQESASSLRQVLKTGGLHPLGMQNPGEANLTLPVRLHIIFTFNHIQSEDFVFCL
jgi:hypothetical protein